MITELSARSTFKFITRGNKLTFVEKTKLLNN